MAIPAPWEGVRTSRHRFTEGKSAVPLYAALLTVIAAIGGLAPTVFFSPHGGADWPDDFGLTPSVVPQSERQGAGRPARGDEDTEHSKRGGGHEFAAWTETLGHRVRR